MKTTERDVSIPFSGFYQSWHDTALDDALQSFAEYFTDGESEDARFNTHTTEQVTEAAWGAANWSKAHAYVASEYAAAFIAACDERAGWKTRGRFVEMVSPREYNFRSDELFVFYPRATIRRMRREVDTAKLDAVASERHTSRDGFHSFYSPEWRGWGAVDKWDNVQRATLLLAWLETLEEGAARDIESDIIDGFHSDNVYGDAIDDAIDLDEMAAELARDTARAAEREASETADA